MKVYLKLMLFLTFICRGAQLKLKLSQTSKRNSLKTNKTKSVRPSPEEAEKWAKDFMALIDSKCKDFLYDRYASHFILFFCNSILMTNLFYRWSSPFQMFSPEGVLRRKSRVVARSGRLQGKQREQIEGKSSSNLQCVHCTPSI